MTKPLALAVLLSVSAPALAQTVGIEAEDFTASHDLGGLPIQASSYGGCSGGWMLVGLDLPGEWATYGAPVDSTGIYSFKAWCRGDAGAAYLFRVEFEPEGGGDPETIGLAFTGVGYG